MIESINRGNVEACKSIVTHGFPVNDPIMDCGINLLMHVAATCQGSELEQVLTLNPDLNKRDKIGRTALHFACRAGKVDTF